MKENEPEGFNKERDSVKNLEMTFSPEIWRYPDGNQFLVQDEDFQEVLFKMIKLSEVRKVWVEVDKNDEWVWEEYPDFRKHRTFYRLQMYSPPDGYRFISSYTELSNGLTFGVNGIYTTLTFPSKQQAYELFARIYKTSVAEIRKLEDFPPEKGIAVTIYSNGLCTMHQLPDFEIDENAEAPF
jgi:hypothetical protein